jgi:hypothetical protein
MAVLEVYIPTPRKRVTKKEITVKKEVKQEVKEPSPVLSDTPPVKDDTQAPSTPLTMITLPKRPRMMYSELPTPTRAPKARRVGVRTRAQAQDNAE